MSGICVWGWAISLVIHGEIVDASGDEAMISRFIPGILGEFNDLFSGRKTGLIDIVDLNARAVISSSGLR